MPDRLQVLEQVRLLLETMPEAIDQVILRGPGVRVEIDVANGAVPLPAIPSASADPWASGPRPKRRENFHQVYWPGRGTFTLSRLQARIVETLWDAQEQGRPSVSQAELLRNADSDCTRLRDLFRRSPAWGALVLQDPERPGYYRLPELPPPQAEVSSPSSCNWGSGPVPKHTDCFERVYWPGLGVFALGRKQARVVEALWEQWQEGNPQVPQADLLRAADSDCARLIDLFRNSPAWGRLVLRDSELPGHYRLPELDTSIE